MRLLVLSAVSTSLCVAFVDASLALSAEPTGLPSAVDVLVPLALLAALALAATLPLAVLLGRSVSGRLDGPAVALSFEAAAVTLFTLLWLMDLNRISAFMARPGLAVVRGGIVLAASLLAGVGLYNLARHRALREVGMVRIATAVPLLLGVLCGALVLLSTSSHTTGSAVRALGALVACGVAAAGLQIVRSTRPVRLAWGLGTALVAVIMSATIALAPKEKRAEREVPVATPAPGAPERIILLTVDTLRRDALTCYHPEGAGTRSIDTLAQDAVLFTEAFAAAPWTIPSFVSMLTGVSAMEHGVNHDFAEIPPRYVTLAELLRAAGYVTAAIGHHAQLLRMNRGFDRFDFTPRRHRLHPRMTAAKLIWRIRADHHTTDDLSNLVGAWLKEHGSERFFLWVHHLDPHAPYEPPERFLPDDPLVTEYGRHTVGIRLSAVRSGRQIKSPRERRWLRLLYDAEVRWVDESIGKILDHLKRLELYGDTLIVFTSDHGEEFWEHGNWEHGHSLYNELLRVPLIVKLPGAPRRRIIDEPVTTAALAPTLLGLVRDHGPVNDHSTESFAALLRGEELGGSAPLFVSGVEYYEPREAVILDGMKYIRRLQGGVDELYDLTSDPGEMRSLVSEHPELVAHARTLLQRVHRRTDADHAQRREFGGDTPGLNPSIEEELRALGYID